jgi:hypothetical protein
LPLHKTSLGESRPPLRESRLGNSGGIARESNDPRCGPRTNPELVQRRWLPTRIEIPRRGARMIWRREASRPASAACPRKRKRGMRVRKPGRPAMDDGAREPARRPIATKIWNQMGPGPNNKASSAGPRGEPTGGNTEFADMHAAHAAVPLSRRRLEREGSTGRTPEVLGRGHGMNELARHDPRDAPAREAARQPLRSALRRRMRARRQGHWTMREALPIVSP